MKTKNEVFLRRGKIEGYDSKGKSDLDFVKFMHP